MVERAATAHYQRQVGPPQLASSVIRPLPPHFLHGGGRSEGGNSDPASVVDQFDCGRLPGWQTSESGRILVRYDRQGADNGSFRLPEMRADLPSYPKAPARWGRTV